MASLARQLNRRTGNRYRIEQTTDRRAAFDGASFVLNSVAIERNRLWKLDFEIPRKYGIRQTLGENGGPGGLFFTLRTLPLIFDIVRDMEEICPGAYFLNYSNPESRIVLALNKYTRTSTVGLCHGIFMARGDICRIIDRSWHDLELWGAGLNHFQWVMGVRDRATGKDLYPLLREREKTHDPADMPLSRRLFRTFGLWPTCSDAHMGEYVAYGWEGGEHGHDFAADERERAEMQARVDGIIAGTVQIPDEWFVTSGEQGIPIVEGILQNQKRYIQAAVQYNRGAIPNLPYDLAVELPAVADANGVHPASLGPLPNGAAKLLTMPAQVQQLATEAAVHADKELALQALLVDPVVDSTDAAVKLLDELWEINAPYIRKCV